MTIRTTMAILAVAAFTCSTVACTDKYQEGYDEGYEQGFEEGKTEGMAEAIDCVRSEGGGAEDAADSCD